ncbi:sensor histidine kinase [Paenibacillus sp. J2TS4]|uniref:cache domain-containing sensor histidine kinase n=1 Tax=Paenibacillus sp. J2TS4 TaxID=2807194 RepID=UPI001B297FA9|nr:sensor histidine kinase [Paenibacillus sp. J2TS4]GIP34169.1 sensor histidine kinase YesM [Paenibacillus sp. J2TS4]
MELRKRLILLFLMVAVTPLALLGAFSYYKSAEVILEQVCGSILENLSQVNHSINYFVRDIEQLSMYIYSNEEIQEVLSKDKDRSLFEKHNDRKKINGILESFLGFKNWDISIYLLGENGDRYFTGELLPNSYRDYNIHWGLFRKANLANGNVVWDTHYAMKKMDDFGVVLSSGRMLKNIETNQPLGYLVIDIMEPALADKYNKAQLYPGGEVFLLDRNGYVVSSLPSKHQVGTKLDQPYISKLLEERKGFFRISPRERGSSAAMVTFDTSEMTGFKLVNVVPVSALTKEGNSIRNLTLIIIAICILFAFWLAYFLSNNVTGPLRKLRFLMRQVEEGNMNVTFAAGSNDEIGQLGRSFNTMLFNIKQLIREVYEKQLKLREAELKAIQAQFNPHFLYNALDSINWMARIHKVNDISKTVVSLGELLRFSIRKDREIIEVREDIQQIKNYLVIQNMRYRDKFEVHIEIEEEIESYFTLKLLLQPIVENAITHGLEMKEDKGTLRIIGRSRGERLEFIVEDDGVGMSPELLQVMRDGRYRSVTSEKTGIGLANVRRRLELYFSTHYEMEIESGPGQGTRIRIEIPILEERESGYVQNPDS